MGVVFSTTSESDSNNATPAVGQESKSDLFEKTAIDRGSLLLDGPAVQKLVETYSNHYYLPIAGRAELWSLISTALGSSFPNINILFATVWDMFSKDGLCRAQEVLVAFALICDADWRSRLSNIFDIFKSTCTNEIFAEDIMLGMEVVLQACLSLWSTALRVETDRDDVHAVTEEVAIAALDKLGKKPDDGITREDFLLWAVERFKESKTVANEDALLRIYRLQ
mmetsp:Transcript_52/g.102  ORF Transcript_52/g.102 Transcript_52/m.102 type:complete len:224 (-) Transcript_52:123-794(-)